MARVRKSSYKEVTRLISTNADLSKNLLKSVKYSATSIQKLLEHTESLDCWSNHLHGNESAQLVSEIFFDLFVSILLTLRALHKYADMALRAALENSLNLGYFYTHRVEFGWWDQGFEWYRGVASHPWGDGYGYFRNLERKNRSAAKSLFEGFVANEYKQLSRSIHSTRQRLQTADKLFPTVDKGRLNAQLKAVERTLSLINAVLVFTFRDEFANMSNTDRTKVLSAIIRKHIVILRSMNLK